MGALMDYKLVGSDEVVEEMVRLLSQANPGKVAVVVDLSEGARDETVGALTGIDMDEVDYDDLPIEVSDEIGNIVDNSNYAKLVFESIDAARDFAGKVFDDYSAAFNGNTIGL